MDDRDLEARLRSHLHATLDDAKPSPDLAVAVQNRRHAEPVRVGGAFLRARPSLRFGLALAAAAVVVAALAVGGVLPRPPASGGRTPAPSASAVDVSRSFIVLPPTASVPSKADTGIASSAMEHRLQALGVANFTGGVGYGIEWTLGPDGPSDADVRAVLAAPGVASLVFLPVADYPPDIPVAIGEALPKPEPDLVGEHGIGNVREATDQQGNPALNIDLSLEVTPFFASDSANHVGDQLALLLDRRVVSVAVLEAPITDGKIQIVGPTTGAGIPATTRAILVGGKLPAAWRGAWVPPLIPSSDAKAIAFDIPGVTSEPRELGLDARLVAGQWRPVWMFEVDGRFPQMCAIASSQCPELSTQVVPIDAVNGGVMGFESPSP